MIKYEADADLLRMEALVIQTRARAAESCAVALEADRRLKAARAAGNEAGELAAFREAYDTREACEGLAQRLAAEEGLQSEMQRKIINAAAAPL